MAHKRKTGRPARRPLQPVREPAQIALLASAVRQDIVDTLEALGGEADVATAAAELGRPADGLYYHFELLADGGLLHRVEATGARRYRVGRTPGTRLQLDYGGRGSGEAVAKVVDRLLQAAKRDFRHALAEPGTVLEGEARELWAGRTKGWVDEAGLREINRLIGRINALLQAPRRQGRDRLVGFSYLLAPQHARPRRRA